MTILIKMFRVDPESRKMSFPGKIVMKIPNEDITLDFDYTNPDKCASFIKLTCKDILKKNNREMLRWQVCRLGGNPPFIQYFPGYDTEGNTLSVKDYGII